MAARAVELELPSLALTDHGLVAGWRPFSKAMHKVGVKPVLGIEAYQARVSRKIDPAPVKVYKENKAGKMVPRMQKQRDAAHLILLAQNDTGVRNIRTISHYAHTTGFYYSPRVDWDLLEEYNEGVIATSACLGGLVSQDIQNDDLRSLNRYLDIFGDRFYIELHGYSEPIQHEVNEMLVSVALDRGLQFVAASDAHYCSEQNYDLHEIMLCLQQKEALTQHKGKYAWSEDPQFHHPPDLWIMDEATMRERLSYLPEGVVDNAIENTSLIAESVSGDVEDHDRLHLPSFFPEVENPEVAQEQSNDRLFELMDAGLQDRYGVDWMEQPEVADRAAFEYEAITEAGLGDYFLITWDWVDWCHRNGILTGPGRGSAAGSILAYSLKITDVCPIKYGLFFERFWNPGRADGLPDIDVDVPQAARSKVKAYLARRWGEDYIRDLGTQVRLQPKSAIDGVFSVVHRNPDTGKVPGEIYDVAREIKAIIEQTDTAGQAAPWRTEYDEKDPDVVLKEGIFDLVGEQLEPYVEKYPDEFATAEDLTGRLSTYGRHPSAVIISDVPLNDILPGRHVEDKKTGEITNVTQIEMEEAEKSRFLKADVLGLRNLDTLQRCIELIPEFDGLNPNDVLRWISEDDPSDLLQDPMHHGDPDYVDPIYEMLTAGLTLGLFQIEDGHAARQIAREMQPRNLEDLGMIVALNRPGPLRSKDEDGRSMVERYMARRNEGEALVYRHEILADILSETYAEPVYQESVLAYFAAIGYTPGEGDEMRRILGKKKVKDMVREHPRYLERATQHMSEEVADLIWNDIIEAAKYQFNKSHSVAYGKILLWTMWMKYHFPTEYILACIETAPDVDRIGAFINEGIRMGVLDKEVRVQPPDINRSEAHASKQGDEILFGLAVKGVSETAIEWVMENRPFESYQQMLDLLEEQTKVFKKTPPNERPDKSPKQRFGAGMHRALLNAGAFDTLHGELLQTIKVPRINRNGNEVMDDAVGECTPAERALHEAELLGVTLTDIWADTIDEWREEFDISEEEYLSMCHYSDIELGDSEVRQVVGVVSSVDKRKRPADANFMPGKPWGFVTVEWRGEKVRFAVWAQVWEKYSHAIKKGNLGRFSLKCEERGPVMIRGERIYAAE